MALPPMMSLPPVVFFDAVGTLLHPQPPAPAAYAAVGRRHGSRLDESAVAARFRAAFRRQEEADHTAGLRTDEGRELARWRAVVAEVLDDVSDGDACFRELHAHFARPDAWLCEPETGGLIAALAGRGHVVGIASNFDRRLRGLVEHLPALRPVRHLVISSEVGWRKPAGEFFAALCRQAGAAPADVLHVGDDPVNDYQGARSAGLGALLLDPHGRSAVPADGRIASLGELLRAASAAR